MPGDCTHVQVSEPYPNPVERGNPVFVNLVSECPKIVSWKVYTVSYRMVAQGSVLAAGKTTLMWDQKDAKGSVLANGVYYWKFDSGAGYIVRKLMILR